MCDSSTQASRARQNVRQQHIRNPKVKLVWEFNELRGQQPETDEAVSRIEFDSAALGREDQAFAVDVGSKSLSATLCPTKAFSEYLVETFWHSWWFF